MIQRTLICVLLVLTSTATFAQLRTIPTNRVGIYAAGAFNFSSPEVAVWQGTAANFPGFEPWISDTVRYSEGETCLTFVGGAMVGLPISENWHFTGRLGINWLKSSSMITQDLVANSILEHNWQSSLVNIELAPGVEAHGLITDVPVYFLGGLEVGIPFSSSREQTTDQTENQQQFPQQITTGPTEVPETNVRFALMLGAGYTIPLSEGVWLQPEVSYRLPLTQVSSNDFNTPWTVSQLRVGLNLTFGFRSEEEPPPPTPEPIQFGARIDRVTAVDETGSEYNVESINLEDLAYTEMFPLVPYVFYPEKGTEPGAELQSTTSGEEGGFTEQNLTLDALEINKNLLNIVGSRLTRIPHAKLTITGTNDGASEASVPELGNRRALWAKDYLVNRFAIQPDRIAVRTTQRPTLPSSSADPDGIAENRRAELSSNVPDVLSPLTINAENQRLAKPDVVTFHTSIDNADRVAEWNMSISQAGKVLRSMSGTENPNTIDWTIRPNELSGTRVPIDYALLVRDIDGQEAEATGSIPVDYLSSVQKRTENLPDKTIDKYSLVLFDFDKATLTADNTRILEQNVLPSIKTNSTVNVIGYTDRIGGDEHNKSLSMERANTVSRFLQERAKSARYTTLGLGESTEVFSNESPIGRHLSRTVQVIVETPRR